MKQTKPHTEWHAAILRQLRRQTETLLNDFAAQPAARTHADVERAAKALLAITRLADAADARTSVKDDATDTPNPPPTDIPAETGSPSLNRQERRRLAAEARHQPARLPVSTLP